MTQIANRTDFVTIAGKKIQVMRGGEGPTLFYLHSAGGEMDWMPFHNGLAQHFHVISTAHPGFALSEGLDKIDDMQDLVWHYVDVFEHFDLRNVPVVGFSLGGWLGVELAILRPELVSKLVMINAAGLHVPGAPMAEIFIDDLIKLRDLLFYDPTIPIAAELMPTSHDDMRILQFLRAREATARVAWSPYLHNPKLPAHLHRVRCPTLLIWGENDKLIPVAHGDYYAEHIAGSRLVTLPETGHMLPYERPDEMVELTTEFINKESK